MEEANKPKKQMKWAWFATIKETAFADKCRLWICHAYILQPVQESHLCSIANDSGNAKAEI